MRNYLRRALVILTLLALAVTYIPLDALAAPQTHPNYYTNTGDQRVDIIEIARTQLGYLEGPGNDTKYGEWYGYNHIAWCGIYVAWCANQAGVPTSVLARTGLANPAAYGLTTEPAGYIPKSGDLFFAFDNSHVGFVWYVDGNSGYFVSLEGNTTEGGPEGVYSRRHRLTDVKFASPKYQGGGSHNYILGTETDHPHKEFYRCNDCGDQYYTGKSGTRGDCTVCIQANCSHRYSAFSKISEQQHGRSCSLCGKQENGNHNWNSGSTVQAATCSTGGSLLQTCLSCSAQRTVYTSATGNHNFTAWSFKNDQFHARKCGFCGTEEYLPHTIGDAWETDEDTHWHHCSVCNKELDKKAHTFGDECDSPCEICEYVRPEGHQFKSTFDNSAHWQQCSICELKTGNAAHSFTSECDETCETCDFTRATNHKYESAYGGDDSAHWFACEVCGDKKDVQSHTPQEGLRQGAINKCTVCEKVLTSESMHTHGYDEVYFDADRHWGSCSCGMTLEPTPHQWSVKTERCAVCGQAMPLRSGSASDFQQLIPWVAGAVGFLAFGILLLILLLHKKK